MSAIAPAAFAADGDPRLSDNGEGIAAYNAREIKALHDPNVYFEEYYYYAQITRKEEEGLAPAKHPLRMIASFKRNKKETQEKSGVNVSETVQDEKAGQGQAIVSDEEWLRAARAGRTATWGAVFYLITTDILGPFSAPWAIAQMGYGQGIGLYAIFGALAGYGGWLLWKMWLDLDSNQYPCRTYGDVAYRIFGNVTRHFMQGLQSLQLIFNVGIITLGNGQGIYEVNDNICFMVCVVIWVACGMLIGQIRTLQKFGWIANLAIWLNVIVMIITMAAVANEPPFYYLANKSGIPTGPPGNRIPVIKTAGPPAGVDFEGQVVGLMQAVFAYGGAMIFCEFMSEMRKPHDFWKGMITAQSFIFVCYVFYGVFVYYYQGQYTYNPSYQGIASYGPQTAANIISVISALIAAGLYGNIGIKVMYQGFLQEILKLPELTTRKGKIIWVFMVFIYWSLAFLLAAAIPDFSNLSGLIAALCILQFTYTFPPILWLGYQIKLDAMQPGEGFDPTTGRVVRHDNGWKRWKRGIMSSPWGFKGLLFKIWNLIFFLGSVVTAILGIYSSIKGLVSSLGGSTAHTSFSCNGPT